jgi:polyferredoxin
MLLFGVVSIFVISPFLTYKYGKRWYCSWVCGCGGLAETAGDSFRQLSSKKNYRPGKWNAG